MEVHTDIQKPIVEIVLNVTEKLFIWFIDPVAPSG